MTIKFPSAFRDLFRPSRYKVFYGGRSSSKSWSAARALISLASRARLRILCAREYQNSIGDSVIRLLADQISAMGLSKVFEVSKSTIYSPLTGSEFIFKGLHHNANEIKSTEGVDICWVEEAQRVSKDSWELLIPTIRKANSEIWVTFNPEMADDETYRRFVANPPPNSVVKLVNYNDNPFHTAAAEAERAYSLSLVTNAKDEIERQQAQADYDHIWLGAPRRQTAASVIKRWTIEQFESPVESERFYYGIDFGFSSSPTAALRCFVKKTDTGERLFVDYEAYGFGVEIDETPTLMETIPGARAWPWRADSARPETISFLRRQGFQISAADKWGGSVEDGLAHLNGFERIVIHPRCKKLIDEARLYSYKVDRVTNDILPLLVKQHDHGWDALRYALDGVIQSRGSMKLWTLLAS